jgi:hypothetical protein
MKTMIEPTYEETKEKLKSHNPPPFAYVLMETNEIACSSNGDRKLDHGLFTLRVDQRPDIAPKIDQYLKKGFKILHYANFPKLNDENPKRAELAKLHSKPGGGTAWNYLESHVKRVMTYDPNWADSKSKLEQSLAAKDQELKALQDRVIQMQSKKVADGSLHQK